MAYLFFIFLILGLISWRISSDRGDGDIYEILTIALLLLACLFGILIFFYSIFYITRVNDYRQEIQYQENTLKIYEDQINELYTSNGDLNDLAFALSNYEQSIKKYNKAVDDAKGNGFGEEVAHFIAKNFCQDVLDLEYKTNIFITKGEEK